VYRLGAGVYFATTFDVAKSIAQGIMDPIATGAAVFECNVYLGRTIDFGYDTGKSWHSYYDSATAIHPPWTREGAASYYFPEYCVKDANKCSCIKVTVTEGSVGNVGGVGQFVVSKQDAGWDKIKELDTSQLQTFSAVHDAVTVQNKNPVFTIGTRQAYNLTVTLNRQRTISTSTTASTTSTSTTNTNTANTTASTSSTSNTTLIILALKFILFVASFGIHVKNTVVQKDICGRDLWNPSMISQVCWIVLLKVVRIGYIVFLLYKRSRSKYTRWLFHVSSLVVFFFEMPLLISNAYVVRSCGRIETWSIVLHLSYFFHLFLVLILDTVHDFVENEDDERCIRISIVIIKTFLSVLLPFVMYAPVYWALADKPTDYNLDVIKKLGPHTVFGSECLVYIGTIGWGMWCGGTCCYIFCGFYVLCTKKANNESMA